MSNKIMKKGISIILIFIVLILVVNVLAYESTITVKTGKPNHEISFTPAYSEQNKPIDKITGKALEGVPPGGYRAQSNDLGEVVFNYNLEPFLINIGFQALDSSGDALPFLNGKISIHFKNVILDKFVDIDLNKAEPIIEVYSGDEEQEIIEEPEDEDEVEEVVVEENKVVEEEVVEQKPSSGITGKAISGGKSIIKSKITYYVLGGFLLLAITFFIINKKMNKKGNIKVTKLSEMQENKDKIEHTDDRLDDAERKLTEAKEELDEIKNRKSKLKEAQERLEKDKEELKRLEGDEE